MRISDPYSPLLKVFRTGQVLDPYSEGAAASSSSNNARRVVLIKGLSQFFVVVLLRSLLKARRVMVGRNEF